MNKFLISLIMLFSTSAGIMATSETPSGSDVPPIKLNPKIKPGKGSRAPGMPIYGEYVNQTLYLSVDSDERLYKLVFIKDGECSDSKTLSGVTLNYGYEVSVAAPFSIELTTDAGTVYAGEVF